MILKSYFPLIVAGYVVAVGLFFLSAAVIENGLIMPDPGGRPVLLALSIAFAVAGAVFALMFFKGRLKRSGITVPLSMWPSWWPSVLPKAGIVRFWGPRLPCRSRRLTGAIFFAACRTATSMVSGYLSAMPTKGSRQPGKRCSPVSPGNAASSISNKMLRPMCRSRR